MKINFLTLFPNFYKPFCEESITKRAIEKGLIDVNVIDWRKFTNDKHGHVDDITYGGGHGMVLMIEPIDLALQTVGGHKILLTPQGKVFDQKKAKELSKLPEVTFIAGRYEGFDERVLSLVDEELSIGDYVLTGGELPSMVIADAIVRLIPGVIKEESHVNDSFENDLLDYPQYTRPREYKGMEVPSVLLDGHHEKIAKWRLEKQIEKTKNNRPDLWERRKHEK